MHIDMSFSKTPVILNQHGDWQEILPNMAIIIMTEHARGNSETGVKAMLRVAHQY